MKLIRMLAAAAALVAVTAAPAMAEREWLNPADRPGAGQAPDSQPGATAAELRAQAKAHDLSSEQAQSLQGRVDRVIARADGTQIAINQVVWDGGDTLIPLPGEERARELGVAARETVRGCAYYQFCTYGTRNFTGIVDRMSSCG